MGNPGVSVGISVEEYEKRWNAILKKFGGSILAPSGWSVDEQYFSCVIPPISVPYGDKLTSDQRDVVIRRAEAKFGVKP
jgi:hypothetical protein